jgi:hypothetical protein
LQDDYKESDWFIDQALPSVPAIDIAVRSFCGFSRVAGMGGAK